MEQQSDQSEPKVPCPHCGGSGEIPLTKHPAWRSPRPNPYRWQRLFSGIITVALLAGIAIAYVSKPASDQPPDLSQFGDPVDVPQFSGVEQPLPASGEAWFCELGISGCLPLQNHGGDRARFEIRSTAGQNYLLKLRHPSGNHLLIFVRGGSPVRVYVPMGRYTATYAVGSRWYGFRSDKKYFGAETDYVRADRTFDFWRDEKAVHGVEVTLYAVPSGNLRTTAISADEF